MSKGTSKRREVGEATFELHHTALIAHELKSPLALVRQLSLSIDGDSSPKQVEQTLQRIQLTSERALRLTSDLAKTQRLDDSLFALEPINPVSLCDDVVYELAPLFAARGREIVVRARGRSRQWPVVANRDLLRRIIMNLADNALEYSDEISPVALGVSTHASGQRVRIAVRDYGPTIPIDVWRSIRKGVAGPQMLVNRPLSSGLGLYISQRFAETMSASLGVIRHRDGVSLYVDLMGSTQLSLL